MRLELGIIADAANLSDGKLNVLGEFNQILTNDMPCVLAKFTLVIRLEGGASEAGEHDLALRLVDPTDKSITLLKRLIAIGPLGGFEEVSRGSQLLSIESALFFAYGRHRIAVDVAGKEVGWIPLNVAKPPAA